jgi:hypothetical protein
MSLRIYYAFIGWIMGAVAMGGPGTGHSHAPEGDANWTPLVAVLILVIGTVAFNFLSGRKKK